MGNTANCVQGGTRGRPRSARLVVEILKWAASGDLAAELSMDYELTEPEDPRELGVTELGVTILPKLFVAPRRIE